MKTTFRRQFNTVTLVLWAGDLAMLLLFTAVGGREHRMELTAPAAFHIALPFLIAWTTVGFAAGAFRPAAYTGAGRAAKALAAAWVAALPVGLVLRDVMYGKPIFTVFAVLALMLIYAFLLVWRLLFTAVIGNLARKASKR